MTSGFIPRWSDEERARLAKKLDSVVEDNGLMHYGMGMSGSLCGVMDPDRQETHRREKVKCKKCLSILRSRP